jgi:hypothetical protein
MRRMGTDVDEVNLAQERRKDEGAREECLEMEEGM